MAQTVCVIPSAADLARLSAIVVDRARPLKHIQRARIVLLSAERLSVLDVAHQAGVSRPAVWRWQQRYAEEGVEGLLRETRLTFGGDPAAASEAEQDRLEEILTGLDGAQWAAPSAAAGWNITDVVLHLAQTEEAVAATVAGTAGATDWHRLGESVDAAMAAMTGASARKFCM